MKSESHREINFLIKAFARYCSEADCIQLFIDQFGKEPTRFQLSNSNLGKFLNDRRSFFKNNHRVRRFRDERDRYEASKENLPIASQAWRMEQYQNIYDRSLRRAAETGNYSRNLDILTLAAKDGAGFYSPKTQINNIDNRSVNVNLSDDEINKRLTSLLQQFNVSIPDIPLIERGARVIEHEEDSEQQD